MKSYVGLVCTALLTACAPVASNEEMHDNRMQEAGVETAYLKAPPAETPDKMPEAVLPQLAYEYAYNFEANRQGVEGLSAEHQSACEKAGAGQCQIIAVATRNSSDDSWTSKTLELRVSPQWLKDWRTGLEAGLKDNAARIIDEDVTSEDLSLRIVDTEAHITNRIALRDRLQVIIRTHSGKVSELVEAEAQLSNVQQEIDAAQSALAVMKTRVATVKMTLRYNSQAHAASRNAFAPVKSAVKGFVSSFMEMLGFLITLFAYLLPVAIVAIPAFIFGRRWIRARKAKVDKKS